MYLKEILPEQYIINDTILYSDINLTKSDLNLRFNIYDCINDPDDLDTPIGFQDHYIMYKSINITFFNDVLKKLGINYAFVIEMPSAIYGDKIKNDSFLISDFNNTEIINPYNSTKIISISSVGDLLYDISSDTFSSSIGNIYHDQGIIIITDKAYYDYFKYALIQDITHTTINISLQSELLAHSHQIDLLANKSEFGYTLNPTAYSGSNRLFAVDSGFTPYVTNIGLYDSNNQLVAITSFNKPVEIQKSLDSIFIIKFDT